MIKIHLSALLGELRINQADLSRRTGIRPGTINLLYHDIADRIAFEHLDRICEVLDCAVADIVEYIPNETRKTGKDLILEDYGNRKHIK